MRSEVPPHRELIKQLTRTNNRLRPCDVAVVSPAPMTSCALVERDSDRRAVRPRLDPAQDAAKSDFSRRAANIPITSRVAARSAPGRARIHPEVCLDARRAAPLPGTSQAELLRPAAPRGRENPGDFPDSALLADSPVYAGRRRLVSCLPSVPWASPQPVRRSPTPGRYDSSREAQPAPGAHASGGFVPCKPGSLLL